LFIVFVYLFAVESFTAFLYPDPQQVASFFQTAALPSGLFDAMIVISTLMTIAGWTYLYMTAHGRTMRTPRWLDGLKIRLYVLFMNRLYADELYELLGDVAMRLIHRFDKRKQGWSQ